MSDPIPSNPAPNATDPSSAPPPPSAKGVMIGAGLVLLLLAVGAGFAVKAMIHPPPPAPDEKVLVGDPVRGKTLYAQSCASCHNIAGYGMPMQGASLVDSKMVAGDSDQKLVAFIRRGRGPNEPDSVMKLNMPAKGGNFNLTDQDLYDIVAHMRKLVEDDKK